MVTPPRAPKDHEDDGEAGARRQSRLGKIRNGIDVVDGLLRLGLHVQQLFNDEEPAPSGCELLVRSTCSTLRLVIESLSHQS